jgi:hypothetical protein
MTYGKIFDSGANYTDSRESQLANSCRQKRNTTLPRFNQVNLQLRIHDRNGYTRDPRARTDVSKTPGRGWKGSQKTEAIEEYILDQPHGLHRPNQALRSTPFYQYIQIVNGY